MPGEEPAADASTDGGSATVLVVDDGVDAVFLCWRIPRLSGDEVLAEVRERGHDVSVAAVTVVEPTSVSRTCRARAISEVRRAS